MEDILKKVIVIGAGAAGLMCAAAAAARGCQVTVYEKNEKAGKKIYITGKGRCNLTNDCEPQEFLSHIVRNPKFLYSALYDFDQRRAMAFFEENGCRLKTERGQRVFPVTDHASDVTRALTEYLQKRGVKIWYRTPVEALLFAPEEAGRGENADDGSEATAGSYATAVGNYAASDSSYTGVSGGPAASAAGRRVVGVRLLSGKEARAEAVVVCTGGLSYPSTGSTGDGYRFAEAAGHTVVPCAPSLVPLTVRDERWLTLQGLALKNVAVRVTPLPEASGETDGQSTAAEGTGASAAVGSGGIVDGRAAAESHSRESAKLKKKKSAKRRKPVYTGFGELLFTHFGLSGPLILSASAYCDFAACPQGYLLEMDLKPAVSEEELTGRLLREFAQTPHRQLRTALVSLFPGRLAELMAALSPLGAARAVGTIAAGEAAALVRLMKAVPVELAGTRGYPEAVVTRGGVSVRELNPSTMASKKAAGLYFAGEVLDVDGLTGGFNLQIAWSTGHLAGESVGEGADDI